MKKFRARYFFVGVVSLYQKIVSPARGFIPRILGRTRETCVFYPSCSEYSKEAFTRHGSIAGGYLTVRRIVRCRPFREMSLDPVPENLSKK